MIFKNLIIKTKIENAVELQKYLFHLGYSWYDSFSRTRHRQIKKFNTEFGYSHVAPTPGTILNDEGCIYIVIAKSCDLTYRTSKDMETISKKAYDFDKYKTITYEQFTRKIKLKKLNESII